MRTYRITVNGHTFEVKILDDPRREQVRVEVDGEAMIVGVEPVAVTPEPTATVPPSAGIPTAPPAPAPVAGAPTSERTVTAPLPGIIKSIAVRPGQRVEANEELVVIEAMKMDNVIRAPRDGTVETVHVTEGRQVAYGEPLLDFAD